MRTALAVGYYVFRWWNKPGAILIVTIKPDAWCRRADIGRGKRLHREAQTQTNAAERSLRCRQEYARTAPQAGT